MVTTLQTPPPGNSWCPCSIILGFQHCCKQPVPSIQPSLAPSALLAATSKEHPLPSAWVSLLVQGPGQLWGTSSLWSPGCIPWLPFIAAVGHKAKPAWYRLGQGLKHNRQPWGSQKLPGRRQKPGKHSGRRLVGHSCLMDASQYRAGVAIHARTAASSPWPWLWPHLRSGIQNIPIGVAHQGGRGKCHGIGVPPSFAEGRVPGEGICALPGKGGAERDGVPVTSGGRWG